MRIVVLLLITSAAGWTAESDAVALAANIQARHLPFGTVLDPIFDSPTGSNVVGYTRCGDSALWTGTYLAGEAFRYKITGSADALAHVKSALAGLKSLVDVTGDNRLARCIVPADSPFAAGIESEEAHNTVHTNGANVWLDNTSRDQVVGAFFGLGTAFDLVDDASVKASAADLVSRLIGFVSRHQWSPNDDISNTFLLRPEELKMLVQISNRLNPSPGVTEPVSLSTVALSVSLDTLSNSSYFKFNLDYLSFYQLGNQSAYQTLRTYTMTHQNAFFNMVDRALTGPNPARDQETRDLLDQWLLRPRRNVYIDNTGAVPVCGSEACAPIPLPKRPTTDYLWQRDPFQLAGGGNGDIESAGIDYTLPYWMARYYGVIAAPAAAAFTVQSAAAPIPGIAPDSLASLYGSFATNQVTITDATGTSRTASVLYASASQINFLVPGETAIGSATVQVGTQTASTAVLAAAPALFSLGSVAAATAIGPNGAVTVFTCSATNCTPIAIDVSSNSVYLSLFGTGLRHAAAPDTVVHIGPLTTQPLYVGPAPGFLGLDQVNVFLPATLIGTGANTVTVGASNPVVVNIL